MFKQNTMDENEFFHEDLFDLEDFLLAHNSSKQAFINLSRIKEFIRKEELIEEIKRLIKEQMIKQIKMNGFY